MAVFFFSEQMSGNDKAKNSRYEQHQFLNFQQMIPPYNLAPEINIRL